MLHETPGFDGRGSILHQPVDRRALLKLFLGGAAATATGAVFESPKVKADNAIETTGTPPKRVETSYLGRKLLVVRPETWGYEEIRSDDGIKKILLTKKDTTSIGEITLVGKYPLQQAIKDEKNHMEKTWDTGPKPSYYTDPDVMSFTQADRKSFLNQYDMEMVYGFTQDKLNGDTLFERVYLLGYQEADGQHIAKLKLSQSQSFIFANNNAMITPCGLDRNDFYVTTVGNFQVL